MIAFSKAETCSKQLKRIETLWLMVCASHPPAVYISQQDVLDKVLLNFNHGKKKEEMVPL
jgi:hypothetical protein